MIVSNRPKADIPNKTRGARSSDRADGHLSLKILIAPIKTIMPIENPMNQSGQGLAVHLTNTPL